MFGAVPLLHLMDTRADYAGLVPGAHVHEPRSAQRAPRSPCTERPGRAPSPPTMLIAALLVAVTVALLVPFLLSFRDQNPTDTLQPPDHSEG